MHRDRSANDRGIFETSALTRRDFREGPANVSDIGMLRAARAAVLQCDGERGERPHGGGERGLWFKMSFFEGSSRVPLMICAPGVMKHELVETPVSTIDVCPTLCDLAGVSMDEVMSWTTGESLVHLGQGGQRTSPVAMEYAAEASYAPLVSLRYGKWKYTRCALDPDQLFDLEADPHERVNLAGHPEHQGTVQTLRAKSEARWDLARFDADVRASQAKRWVVYEALRQGGYYPWDYQPLQKASEQFMRNHMNLNTVEENQRFPRGE